MTGKEQDMEGEAEGVVVAPESPAGSTPSGEPTPPAASQPGPNGQPAGSPSPEQTVPYSRFREVIGKNQQLTQAVNQLQGRLQERDALAQKAQQQGGLSQEDQQSYREAAKAIKQIFDADPDLKILLDVMKNGQQVLGTQQTVQSMQQAQLRTMERQGVNRILELADKEQLPKDQESRSVFIKLVESLALTIPQAKERFAAGDLALLDEAFEKAKPLLAHIKREGQTQLLDTKTRTRNLPPAPRGGAAGPAGLPKFNPDKDDPRAYQTAMNKAAQAMLGERQG